MKNKYLNPWRTGLIRSSVPEYYENDAPKVFSHRGVDVFKLSDKSFDFVLAGCAITQRAGASDPAKVINQILDGETPVGDQVAKHLCAHGFNAMSYAQAGKFPADGSDSRSHTPAQIINSARDHVAYGWTPRPWGHWTDEQLAIYRQAYDEAKAGKEAEKS